MNLASMRFKDYVWPHNPRVYEMKFGRELKAHRVPFGGTYMQDMGRQQRILKGEGEFCGANAYGQFRKLAQVFLEDGAGMLTHPLWGSVKAQFAALKLRQEPTENFVAYSFEFRECDDSYGGIRKIATGGMSGAASSGAAVKNIAEYYTAVRGDYLYKIARNYGLTLPELLSLNPQIKNPNLILIGDRIRVK